MSSAMTQHALILVVDDERDQRELYAQSLRDAGYAVAEAADAHEAMALVRRLGPAAIVMDYQMPGTDGIRATRELKGRAETENIPILVLTAATEQPLLLRAVEAGADAFLGKPCTPEALASAVTKALRDARQRAVTIRHRRDEG